MVCIVGPISYWLCGAAPAPDCFVLGLAARIGHASAPDRAVQKAWLQNIFRTGVASRNPRGCLMMSEVVICTFPVPCETQSCEQNYYYAVKIGF